MVLMSKEQIILDLQVQALAQATNTKDTKYYSIWSEDNKYTTYIFKAQSNADLFLLFRTKVLNIENIDILDNYVNEYTADDILEIFFDMEFFLPGGIRIGPQEVSLSH
jgi:hypothetical protein